MIGVDWLIEQIEVNVRGGHTPAEAYKKLSQLPIPGIEELLKEALRKFEEKTGRIRTLREPITLRSDTLEDWYTGPSDDDLFWPALRDYLIYEKKRPQEVVNSIDQASTKIVSLLQPPGFPKISTRGLVIGYVQSGKTANFSAVIAKAADVNYKFFVVLSGMTNLLRFQTQSRLEQEIVETVSRQATREHWFTLTSLTEDFKPGPYRNVDAFLTDKRDFKVLCVVKKNAAVLRRLLRWLERASQQVLSSCPVLIIDDEADQASVNAAKADDERTKINELLLQILSYLPKAAYVGYTATPFANVLIDPSIPEDLYPRDFIVDLAAPANYFGPARIFGRDRLPHEDADQDYIGLDMIRIVPDEDIPMLRPQGRGNEHIFDPELTLSVQEALQYFWMAAAARLVRGQHEDHSTMLIHTTLYTSVHDRLKEPVEKFQRKLVTYLNPSHKNFPTVYAQLKEQWMLEQASVSAAEMGEVPVSFDELWQFLPGVVKETAVVVENSKSQKRLDYGDDYRIRIVIGGNVLSRGLTLEGLIVSFFVRASTAYDTVLQAGRWFGYRDGYSDLPRIWMTRELAGWFYDLATVEQEIRNDIARYERHGITPLDFAVRVRAHPKLMITDKLKMRDAIEAKVSYDGQRIQTIHFHRSDAAWLQNNIQAASRLIMEIQDSRIDPSFLDSGNSLCFPEVSVDLILPFFDEFRFHKDDDEFVPKLLKGYIRAQNKIGDLYGWNVVIKGRERRVNERELALGRSLNVPLLTRTRRSKYGAEEDAHVGSLMSVGDRVIDLGEPLASFRGKKDDQLQEIRDGRFPNIGLLILYPIDKDSTPQGTGRSSENGRKPLEAIEDLIGVGMVFPTSKVQTPQKYYTANLSNIPRDELDWDFEDEAE